MLPVGKAAGYSLYIHLMAGLLECAIFIRAGNYCLTVTAWEENVLHLTGVMFFGGKLQGTGYLR